MFEVKRREQLLALKNLAQLNDIHQQYKILDVMLKGLFLMHLGMKHLNTPQHPHRWPLFLCSEALMDTGVLGYAPTEQGLEN